MPISDLGGFPVIMAEVQQLNPQTVVELGIGFGLIGAGCRQTLDAQYGRVQRKAWRAHLLGYEIFPGYDNPQWAVYDEVRIMDFMCQKLKGWDLGLMIDSLEHVEPQHGRPFLAEFVKYNKRVIVSVPNGRMDQGTVFGNESETHRWTFTDLDEFAAYKYKVLHRGVCTVVSIEGGT